ncbi:MAG: DUF934 domain-containing protein [Alphaproteobacteria bacterium]|nr:DUF934 domain-containing protein [Alphaproteobacteria bacterium]
MPLLRNNAVVADSWFHAGLDDPLPVEDDVFVPFGRLLREFEALSKRNGRLGVVLTNVDKADSIAAFLPRLSAVILPFPAFNDGRAYSIARQLRDLGFRGEIRATGNVLPDQLQFMLQVGFDCFDIGERFPLALWQGAARQMSLAYQRGLFRRNAEAEVWTERHTDAEPWLEQPHAG